MYVFLASSLTMPSKKCYFDRCNCTENLVLVTTLEEEVCRAYLQSQFGITEWHLKPASKGKATQLTCAARRTTGPQHSMMLPWESR